MYPQGVLLYVKPWPNGVASRCRLKTWVCLRLRLARPCVHLHWLAMTCTQFGRQQICTQVVASFSAFDHPTQVNASWVTAIKFNLPLLLRLLESPFGQDFSFPTASIIKPWPNRVITRRKLKTWVYLRLRLPRACVHLRWLAMTCTHLVEIKFVHKPKQVFSDGFATQPKSTQV